MSSNLRIEVAKEHEIPATARLIARTFAGPDVETFMGNIDTPEANERTVARHVRSWQDHMTETGRPSVVQCIHTDPQTGKESIAACAQWFIFDTPRSAENVEKPNYHMTGEWLSHEKGEPAKAEEIFRKMAGNRAKWMRGRGMAILQFMATDEAFRRRGAATMVVRWGLEECAQAGIPAYLEASPEGVLVYEKLGFEVMDQSYAVFEGERIPCPVMIWWPPGTKESEKRPLG